MDRVVVKNDLKPVPVAILVGGKELLLDPDIYCVDTEITVKEVLEHAAQLEEDGKKAEAIRLTRDTLAEIVLPGNPDWTAEEFNKKITTQQIGWALGFFEILSPSGGRLEREVVDRIATILTTGKAPEPQDQETPGDSTSTPKTQETPSK